MERVVPVTIITGFLGSGKTTILNRLLKRPTLKDTAVIINEFGEIGIDHLLIEEAIENTVLLKNGCICCTVRGDIADTLDHLFQQRREGRIPPFERIAIETTGLADPGPVAHTLVTETNRAFRCRLDGIVTAVDALHGAMQLHRQPEARNQVALADRLLLTKSDIATPEQQQAVVNEIERLNATAPIRRVSNGDVDPSDVFDLSPSADAPTRVVQWLHGTHASRHHHDHDHDHGATHHLHVAHEHARHDAHDLQHDHDIHSLVITRSQPIAWSALQTWLDSILSLRGGQILRLKGLVHLAGREECPLILQGVHHVIHPPVWLTRWPIEPHETQLVLITRGLSEGGLRASFDAAMSSAGTDT